MIVEYVEGFLKYKGDVVLIRKNKPQWMAGLLNGVGGHVEPGEKPLNAMRREFQEEAGLLVQGWREYLSLNGKSPNGDQFYIHFFEHDWDGNNRPPIASLTDEKCMWYSQLYLKEHQNELVGNLSWIIPMAFDINKPEGYLEETV